MLSHRIVHFPILLLSCWSKPWCSFCLITQCWINEGDYLYQVISIVILTQWRTTPPSAEDSSTHVVLQFPAVPIQPERTEVASCH